MPAARPRRAAAFLAAALALAAACAGAQTIYRWIDADGKVHYGDQLPKGYTGPATRIEPDKPADGTGAPPSGVTVITPPRRTELSPPPTEDVAGKRRATREKLEAQVEAARARLAAARKARDEAPDAQEDERQIVRRVMDPAQAGVPRSNCTPGRDASGQRIIMCPSPVPGDAYYDRIRQLDEAVTRAEDDLANAQQAYRRGVD
jgi:hypothetical protein